MYQCQVKVEVRDRIASGYLSGAKFNLSTEAKIGAIPVVTLFVNGAEAAVVRNLQSFGM